MALNSDIKLFRPGTNVFYAIRDDTGKYRPRWGVVYKVSRGKLRIQLIQYA